ncbi:MAG: isoleucine--tRNA ligase [Tissierellia bacterium]|nr:isoleucine--tRNA ligase [Tissierellia bacterium]
MEFKPLSQESVASKEKEIAKYWEKIDLLHRSVETREDDKPYIFYEGPPTANGRPGIHHVISRTLKDLTCRYKTMQGYQVHRKAGWDTHGLPVEIEVEKKLDLHNKQDIEKYGVKAFNERCRESVFEYEKEWREMTTRMGYLIDLDDPYITLNNDYIETVWWILDSMYKDGLLYEGHKILPYCPRCGTGLASHEVAQGYEEIKTQTVTVAFKKKDEDAYFLAWTTTPWTLPSNVALAVHPDVDYVKVRQGEHVYYIAKDLMHQVMGDEVEVLETLKGKDMEYMEYEQLLPFVKPDKKGFFVVCADYVTTEDGTGIVHTAPAFGEDDYQIGRKYDLPVVKPVDEDGKFTETPWKGTFVIDADPDIIKYLSEQQVVYKKQRMEHNYPHCWRCHTPLIYYAHPSWYIEVTKFKEQLIKNNDGVNWFPDFVGEKRFGNWLENLNDWAISRSRYWGTPLPVWRCDECGKTESIGSRKELVERSLENIDETIELHRPYVDDVHLECKECHGKMTREEDVIDVWFDSGAMPFAQWHYPFEHKEDFFEKRFPADFINEGIDQTRGWFYSLIAISTYVTGKSPYKNVLVNDLILDKEGKKMSKSRGNTVNPSELFEKYGADVVRWYLMYVSPPWSPTKFDEDGLREVESKFFRGLKNIYNFFSLYANTDALTKDQMALDDKKLTDIDKWLLSKYHHLVDSVNKDMDIFELTRAIRNIQEFVIEDFSNWYIRRNRRRFWKTEADEDKLAVFATTYQVLLGVVKMIAPIVPFIAEELYQTLTGEESVHIDYYPKADKSYYCDDLEEQMDLVRDLVTLGRAGRENAGIKVRQPLKDVVIDGKYREVVEELEDLIKEELNVKDIRYEEDLSQFMNYQLKPNFPVAGPKLGKNIKAFGKVLGESNAKELVEQLDQGPVTLEMNGEDVEITKDFILVNISAKEGFDVTMENNLFVILDTDLDEELLAEGYAREFISKVQQMRKAADFDVMDRITVTYDGDEEVSHGIETYKEYIAKEILADSIEKGNGGETVNLNGHDVGIKVEKN